MKRVTLTVVGVLLAASLIGCNNEKTRAVIDHRVAEAEKGLDTARDPAQKKPYNPLVVSSKVWAGSGVVRLSHGLPLPSKFEGPRGIALITSESVPLAEVANMISNQTGIPVRIVAGAEGAAAKGKPKAAKSDTDSDGSPITYEGPLSGLLEQICGFYGVNWRYDGSAIALSKYETRVFVIEALPGTQSIKDGIKEASNNSSSSGSSGTTTAASTNDLQQTSEMTVELKVWEELEKTLVTILGGVGTVYVAPSSGTVTISTTPELMRTVATFIEQENKRLSRQVAINVEVYSLTLADSTDFGVTLTAAFKKLGNLSYGSAGTPTMASSGLGTLGVTILSTKQGSVSGIVEALSTIGDTTRVAQFPLTTLNNRPVSRRVGHDRTYVASVTNSNSTSSSYSSSTITPGSVQEGFSLQLTPRVLDDGRIMLQYSFSLVDLVNLQSYSAAGGDCTSSTSQNSCVQLPETSNRLFVQQSLLRSGSTLVIGGFDDQQVSQKAQGVGNPFNFLLGGGSSNESSRTMLFIAITPQIIDIPRSEQD